MADHDLVPGSRLRKFSAGSAVVALLLGLTAWLGGGYLGIFTSDVKVEAELPISGDSLGVNSDVKYKGLRVGRVISVEAGTQPTARLSLMAEHVDRIPGDVRARVLPGTLFGNEYVDLVAPTNKRASATPSNPPTNSALSDGAVVPADDSVETVRLMDAFTSVQKLLVAVDPARLDASISQLAAALSGRGDDLHAFLRDAREMADTWETIAPTFHEDVALIARNADTFADLEPQLIQILQDSLPLARLWAQEQKATKRLLVETGDLFGAIETFLSEQHPVLAPMLGQVSAVTSVMAANTDLFARILAGLPSVMENGAAAVEDGQIQMEGVIGLQLPQPYGPEDCPRYGSLKGANCR